ncbi:DUF3500 domain-containing protein [Microcella sp.]|uniref:DUF3500 domain-containing protein n=1 Tax=Microcella sp. TaxID=1913979 RepID=UPI00391A3EAE
MTSHLPGRRRLALLTTAAVAALSLTLAGCSAPVSASTSPTTTTSATASGTAYDTVDAVATSTTAETIAATADAANAFLATLSDEQRASVVYAFDDPTKTTSWTNFPITFVQRAGLNLADLTDEQQAAALTVMQALLSDEAYTTIATIMNGDVYLVENSTTTEASLGQYYIAFFGDPSDTENWAVQFGGHHLGINATLTAADPAITFAPTHLGVQPLAYPIADGETVGAFDGIYSDAFAFFTSLTADQQSTLLAGDVTMCAPGDTCDFPVGAGLLGADLTDEQRALLLGLIANWAGMADEQSTAATRAAIEATLDSTVIAWTGATEYDTTTGSGISFSISGPNVYIGFQAQESSIDADVAGLNTAGWGHVHTIYRDPSNDYANSVEQQAGAGIGAGGGQRG